MRSYRLDAVAHIGLKPGTGSLHYAIPDSQQPLRFWTLDRFPYAVFYMERESLIEIIPVLNQATDIPVHLD